MSGPGLVAGRDRDGQPVETRALATMHLTSRSVSLVAALDSRCFTVVCYIQLRLSGWAYQHEELFRGWRAVGRDMARLRWSSCLRVHRAGEVDG